jgi:predicted Ser/Thr protein kinase
MPADDPFIGFATPTVRFTRLLGKGAMGAVYQGVQLGLEREVAIKVIAETLAQDADYIARFTREARTLGKLVHPNIIACHDFGPAVGPKGESLYLMVLEYVDGWSLGQLMKTKRLTVREALDLHRQAATGLAAAHAVGIVHRDVKPDNIMVTKAMQAKLADFGLARQLEGAQLTQVGSILGSPSYMAPEACRGEEPTTSSDLYSLGCSLFQVLTGQPPYSATSTLQVLHQQLTAPVPTLRSVRPDLMTLDPLLRTCLAKDPAARYANADALVKALHQAQVQIPRELWCGPLAGTAPADANTVLSNVPVKRAAGVAAAAGSASAAARAARAAGSGARPPAVASSSASARARAQRAWTAGHWLVLGVGTAVLLVLIAVLSQPRAAKPAPHAGSTPAGIAATAPVVAPAITTISPKPPPVPVASLDPPPDDESPPVADAARSAPAATPVAAPASAAKVAAPAAGGDEDAAGSAHPAGDNGELVLNQDVVGVPCDLGNPNLPALVPGGAAQVVQSQTFTAPLAGPAAIARGDNVHQWVMFRLPDLPSRAGGLVLLIHANQDHGGREFHLETGGRVPLPLALPPAGLHTDGDNTWQCLAIPFAQDQLMRPRLRLSATGANPFYVAEAVYFPDHLPTGADLRAAPGTLLHLRQMQTWGFKDVVGRLLAAHNDFPYFHHTVVEMPLTGSGQPPPLPPFAAVLLGGFNDALMRTVRPPLGIGDVAAAPRDNPFTGFVEAIPAGNQPEFVLIVLDTAILPEHSADSLVDALRGCVQRAKAMPVLVLADFANQVPRPVRQAWGELIRNVQQQFPGLPIITTLPIHHDLAARQIAFEAGFPTGKAWLQASIAAGLCELRARIDQAVTDLHQPKPPAH